MILIADLLGKGRRDFDHFSNTALGFSALVPPAGSIYEHIQILGTILLKEKKIRFPLGGTVLAS